jgi:D-glycero-alpha-D-manno-heptose 1-phosphate guanylyltransferase
MICVVLCGGLGTRLRNAVPDLPKVMAPVNGKPFLEYIINQLIRNEIFVKDIILSCCYKSKIIKDYFSKQIICIEEPELLGTAGAVRFTIETLLKKGLLDLGDEREIMVVNGDTFLDIPIADFKYEHLSNKAKISIAMVKVPDTERFTRLEIDKNYKITKMIGKGIKDSGFITGGIFIFDKSTIEAFPEKGNLEDDVIKPFVDKGVVYGSVYDTTFLDIGTKESYTEAEKVLCKK